MLSENGLEEDILALFGEPVPRYRKAIALPRTNDPDTLRAYRGEIEMQLDVTSRGEPRNIRGGAPRNRQGI